MDDYDRKLRRRINKIFELKIWFSVIRIDYDQREEKNI